jgi:hypothetical protein
VFEAHVAASMIRLHNHRSHLAVSDYRLGWHATEQNGHIRVPFSSLRCGLGVVYVLRMRCKPAWLRKCHTCSCSPPPRGE